MRCKLRLIFFCLTLGSWSFHSCDSTRRRPGDLIGIFGGKEKKRWDCCFEGGSGDPSSTFCMLITLRLHETIHSCHLITSLPNEHYSCHLLPPLRRLLWIWIWVLLGAMELSSSVKVLPIYLISYNAYGHGTDWAEDLRPIKYPYHTL